MSCLDITGLCIYYFINSPIFAHRGISHFYAHIGAGPKVFTHLWAGSCGFRPFDPGIIRLK